MRKTADNLDSEVSQVVKNTRKLIILHRRGKVKQHPNRALDKLKMKFTYLQATCTPASTLLTFSWHHWTLSALYSHIVHYALIDYSAAYTNQLSPTTVYILLSLLDWQCSYRIYTEDEDDDNKKIIIIIIYCFTSTENYNINREKHKGA